jgi:signal-transduction protein with cAMP-binding, CBS, and nucleotidyltransferase domain
MKIGKFDITRFKEFYQFSKEINLGDVRNLIGSLESKSFGKRELLIKEGSTENQVFFIRKGIVRCFVVNDKGEEITFRLIADTEILVNVDTLLWNQPSSFFTKPLNRPAQ